MKHSFFIILTALICIPGFVKAQEGWTIIPDTVPVREVKDTVPVAIQAPDTITQQPDSVVRAVLAAGDSVGVPKVKMKAEFKPDPQKAVLMALVPGLGQIYNRKYWKLPIVYGAFMGCMYAVTWNNKTYQDYWLAYKDIMYDSNPKNKVEEKDWSKSWQDFLPAGTDPASQINSAQFQQALKNKKDYFRRYRDLSIIITVGVYALSIIDAYVDAQLFDFDISPDLSMRLDPVVTPKTSYSSATYGLNCSIKF